MVVTIEKAAGSSLSALQYNERKVSRGDAEIVAFANLESLDRDSVKAALSSYENWSKGVLNRSGDMSRISKSYNTWLRARSCTGNGNMST